MLSATLVRTLFSYETDTGILRWNVNRQKVYVGKIAGTAKGNGYLAVMINRKKYYVHRVIWLFVTGENPKGILDHKNGKRDDNRFENLREATNQLNTVNSTRPASKSGFRGVRKSWNNTWSASIKLNGRPMNLGAFDSKEKAYEAYREACKKHFGSFVHPSL
jgi:hypothetical protein